MHCPKKSVSHSCGHCGGAVAFIVTVFTCWQLSGFNLEFDTLLESI